MLLETSLESFLKRWAPLAQNRVRPGRLRRGETLPALCFMRVGGQDRDDGLEHHSGLAFSLFQIDSWGRDYFEAKNLAQEVRLGIVRHPRQQPLVDGGPLVGGMRLADDQDDFDLSGDYFRVIQQVRITHEEET